MEAAKREVVRGLTHPFLGQLGNHMYQYAYIRLLAEKNKVPFRLQSDLIRNAFNASEESFPLADAYDLVKDAGYPYRQESSQLDLILRSRKKVMGWFKPTNSGKSILTKRNFPPVINVRGGDFISIGRTVNPQYYYKSLQHLKVKPIVVTDDLYYSKKILSSFGFEILHTPDDFSILCHAKKLVCSNSTYCWWAAFLGNHDLIISPDRTWVEKIESLKPFLWGIKTLRWKSLRSDGSIGKE